MAEVPLDSLSHQAGTGGPLADTLTTAVFRAARHRGGDLIAPAARAIRSAGSYWPSSSWGSTPASQYIVLDYRKHHGTLPLGWVAVVLQECWPLFLLFITILLWIFPDGNFRRAGGTAGRSFSSSSGC